VENVNLTGHFLIAMPAMTDPRFVKSVTYICEHSADGAIGLVINHPIEMTFQTLFQQINLDLAQHPIAKRQVHFGGPVQPERGFVLHQPPGDWDSTIAIRGNTALTTSKDILESIAAGQGPDKVLLALGYAGWAPGQLEQEMGQNAWLSIPASNQVLFDRVLFDTPSSEQFTAAMNLLGIDLASLSEEAGHA
jgi:putative transcriptional regulator